LEQINGKLYHKHTNNLASSVSNSLFGTKYVEKKEYNRAEESFSEGALFVSEWVITTAAINKLGKAFMAFTAAKGSIWKMASWTERGFVYEAMRGGNLAKNFPTIDKFVKGVATSIKTLDLGAATYLNKPAHIYNKLTG
jgi:hypothetical protein